MNIPLSRRDNRSPVNGASRVVLAHLVVIHPMPVVRRGLIGLLADSGICEASALSGFGSLAQAEPMLATLGAGDVIIVAGEDCSQLERDKLIPQGVGVAAIGSCDSNALRAFEVGTIDAALSANVGAEDLMRVVMLLASGGRASPKRMPQPRLPGGLGRLSQRQFEILELMTRGLLNKQIAWELGLTEGTVKSHVSAILEKLGCSRRTQAIMAFMTSGARDFERSRAA
jgi:DNA-binding NarL/FixJ family response regulator